MPEEKDLRPAPDCRLYILDDAGVLFCEGKQEIHALNTTATAIWLGIEERKGEEEIAKDLARDFSAPLSQTRPAVSAVLQDWRRLGLLAGSESARPAVTRPPAYDPGPLPSPPLRLPCHSSRTYRLLDTTFTVVYGDAEQEAWVHPVLAHLANDNPGPHQVELTIARTEESFLLLRDQVPEDQSPSLESLAPAVKSFFLRTALDNHRYLFQIHSGLVERGGQCLLLPAVAGSGKSSLTAGLIRRGWRYLSDETAPISVDRLTVRPVPMALAIKPGSWNLLKPYYPEVDGLAQHRRVDGKIVRYLAPPPEQMAPDCPEGYPVRWIVFPSYGPERENRLQPLTRIETFGRLLAECLSLPVTLDERAVTQLVEWAAGIEGYLLENSDLEEAIRLIETLPAGHGPAL